MKKVLTKERVYELAFDDIRDLDVWGLSAKEATERLLYISGICNMAAAIILELDKEEEK